MTATQTIDTLAILGAGATWTVQVANERQLWDYRKLRQQTFVRDQGMFANDDVDACDSDSRTVCLVACDQRGEVLGGVRIAPVGDVDLGWWRGSRLVVDRCAGPGVGRALVGAACASVEAAGGLRFEAAVQGDKESFFVRLGWQRVGDSEVAGRPHVEMRWPIDRFDRLVRATKRWLGTLLEGCRPGPAGYVGDDGAPIPGSDLVAATDAILPSMVERDPWWAGWCAVLVNVNDLAAMGAAPVGMLDALAARTPAAARQVLAGVHAGAGAFGVPLLGGHTQVGAPPNLSVTAIGRASRPVPGGGGRAGDEVRLTADLGGNWRPGYQFAQWDSTTTRVPAELQAMLTWVARARPRAAKDVSMAGIVGTVGMLAEASGCGAEIDMAAVPRPAGTGMADWLTCFPGFAMVSAAPPGSTVPAAGPATSGVCGRLVTGAGVTLCWPDGVHIRVLESGVTGLGAA